jgi:uncharacterized protein YjbI with pentapeptide repeats
MKLKGLHVLNCQLHEVDFVECDLTESHFDNCDLKGTLFENTRLTKADFTSARNISIDPDKNMMRGMKIALFNLPGLLQKYGLNIKA